MDRNRKKTEEYRVGDKVLISTKYFFDGVDEKGNEEVDREIH